MTSREQTENKNDFIQMLPFYALLLHIGFYHENSYRDSEGNFHLFGFKHMSIGLQVTVSLYTPVACGVRSVFLFYFCSGEIHSGMKPEIICLVNGFRSG